jgi:hypothetical protein
MQVDFQIVFDPYYGDVRASRCVSAYFLWDLSPHCADYM